MAGNLSAQETALDKYVAKPDSSYSWKIVERCTQPGLTTLVIDLKSQTWRSPQEVDRTLWQHWLIIAKPDKVSSETGLLFISGGKNGGDPPSPPDQRTGQTGPRVAVGGRHIDDGSQPTAGVSR